MTAEVPESAAQTRRPRGPARSLWLTIAAGLVLCTCRPAVPQPSRPVAATATSTGPFVLPVAPQPRFLPIVTAGGVAEALAFDDDEKEILKDVHDGDGQLNAPALYVLLRRAEMLPEGGQTFQEAEQPNPRSFWTEPQRYRGRLVRVSGLPYRRRTDWSKRVVPTPPYWDRRGVFVLYLKLPKISEPLLVFLTRRPPERLPRRVRVAGLFYKLVNLPENPDTGDRSVRHPYPVIVAKTVQHARGGGASVPAPIWVFLCLVVALLVAFMILRRYSRRPPRGQHAYRPAPQAGLAEGRRAADARTDSEDVDEELRRQVEAYRAERRDGEKAKDAGEANDSR